MASTKPIPVYAGDPRDPDSTITGVVVNRASPGDANVVVSYWDANKPGIRQAIGMSPAAAEVFGLALIRAAAVVGRLVE